MALPAVFVGNLESASAAAQQPDPVLVPGEILELALEDGAPELRTPFLIKAGATEAVGRVLTLRVEESGTYTVSLTSYWFDTYLVLRDEGGELLAEDDDGGLRNHSRMVIDLEAGHSYRLQAGTAMPLRGPFELSLVAGEAPQLTGNALRLATLEDAERGLALLEANGEAGGEMFARTLVGHAGDLRKFRRPSEAIEQYERALGVVAELRGADSLDVASLMNSLGQLLQGEVRYDEARPLFERSLEIRLAVLGPTHLSTSVGHNNLGALQKAMGLYEEALVQYQTALEVREQTLEPGDHRIANVQNNLGVLMRALGRHDEGLDYYRRALANYEESRGPNHVDTATCLNNYSGLLREAGRFEEARPLCERALSLHEKIWGPDHHRTATCLQNLAGILMWEGNDLQARRHLERALEINESSGRADHKDTASILNDLAGVLNVMQEYDQALRMYQRALTIFEDQVGEQHPFTIKSLNNLAAILINLERYEEAAPLARRALRLREEALGSGHPQTAVVLNNVAFLERRLGNHDAARPLYERAYALWESTLGPDHPRTLRGRLNLAFLNVDVGRTEEAYALIRSAVAEGQSRAQTVLGSLTEAERYHYLAKLRYQLELQISLAGGVQDPAAQAQTYEALMGWKGRISRSLFASREQRSVDPLGQALMDELRSVQGELSKLVFSRDQGRREEHDARLAELLERRNELELELHRGTDVTESLPPVGAAELRASLPLGSAVLDFFVHREYLPARVEAGEVLEVGRWSEDRLSAWVLRADGSEPLRIALGRAAIVESAVKAFLADLVTNRGISLVGEDEPARDTTLLDTLWAPLAEHLESIETIFLSPDSFLGTLPFETLQIADGSYLIEHHAFVYLADVGSLVRAGERTVIEDRSLLSVGDVDFRKRADGMAVAAVDAASSSSALRSGRPFMQWAKLPSTREESQLVYDLHEEMFGAQTRRVLLQGALPSEERLKEELTGYSFLHLATHGFFAPEGWSSMWEKVLDQEGKTVTRLREEQERLVGSHPGLLSGLVCAGASARRYSPEDDDGYLTAEEVSWLDLRGVELVVLSACETGLGRARSGEGLIGLRRAFRSAGARTVISSLWSVKDDSTGELMSAFYDNLWFGEMGKLEALRAAQLEMLERNRMQDGAGLPSTWGAFVLSGDWR